MFGEEFHVREMRRTAKLVPPSSRLVDIGCGSGLISLFIPQNTTYIGIDFNPDYLAHNWKGRHIDAKIGGNILTLPFRNESFQTALFLHVIEHFPSERQAPLMREVYRVLATNGTLIISTPNLDTLMHADRFLPPNNPKHFHCLHQEELRTLLHATGFTNLRRHGFDMVIEYPNKLVKAVPEAVRRQFAQRILKFEKHLIFTANKP